MHRKLNKKKIQSRKHSTMSMKDSLRNIEPIQWHNDVITGTKTIVIKKSKQ